MTRHMTSVLTGMTLLGLAIAIPQSAFAQNNPLIGTWKQKSRQIEIQSWATTKE